MAGSKSIRGRRRGRPADSKHTRRAKSKKPGSEFDPLYAAAFARVLKEWKKKHKLTDPEAATRAKVSLSRWLRRVYGSCTLAMSDIAYFAEVLEIRPWQLAKKIWRYQAEERRKKQ